MRFDELSIDEKIFIQNSVGAMGVNPARLSEDEIARLLGSFTPPKPPMHDVYLANQANVAQRRYKALQARVDQLTSVVNAESPDLPPVEEFATKYGFVDVAVKEQFTAQQEAAVEELRQAKAELARVETQLEFDEASDKARHNDYLALIQIGDDSSHPWQQQARALMNELWPGYDSWRN